MYEQPIIWWILWEIMNSSFVKITGYLWCAFFFWYLDIPQEQTTLLAILMVLDTVTGLAKSWKLDWGRSITSHKLGMGVLKKALVFIIIVGLAVTIRGASVVIGIDWKPWILLSAVLGVLMVAEFYSICQNIYMFRTGKKVTEYDAVSIVIRNLGEFMREKIDNFLIKK